MKQAFHSPPFYLKIASLLIKVDLPRDLPLFWYWEKTIREYFSIFLTSVSPKKIDFDINLTGPHLKNRRQIEPKSYSPTVKLPTIKPRSLDFDGFLHPAIMFLKLSFSLELLLRKNNYYPLHASGFVVNDSSILVVGEPGQGKSTLLRKSISKFAPLGDDRIIIYRKRNRVVAFPTPFNQKVIITGIKNTGYPIRAIIFPKASTKAKIILSKADPLTACRILFDQTMMSFNKLEYSQQYLEVCKLLSDRCYILEYSLKHDIADFIEHNL